MLVEEPSKKYYEELSFEKFVLDHIFQQNQHDTLPIREDLADWLTKVTGIPVKEKTFLNDLDNGIALVTLADHLQDAIRTYYEKNSKNRLDKDSKYEHKDFLNFKLNLNLNATSGSFYARDNIDNFLKWLKNSNLNENYIFDIDDLIFHRQQKVIISCLLELSRVLRKFKPHLVPNIIVIEHDVQKQAKILHLKPFETEPKKEPYKVKPKSDLGKKKASCESLPVRTKQIPLSVTDSKILNTINSLLSKTNRKVRAYKVKEGYYSIDGRNVFVRILNNKYFMVRVGGGWMELEAYFNKINTKKELCRKL